MEVTPYRMCLITSHEAPSWCSEPAGRASLTCPVVSVLKLHHDGVAGVGDAEGAAGLVGDHEGLQAGVVHSPGRVDVDGGLAVPLGYGVSFVPLGGAFNSKQRTAALFPSHRTQNGHYGFAGGLE